MKYFSAVLFVSSLLLVSLPLVAQPKYVIEWTKFLDNGSNDYAYGIAVDNSGNVYVTGGSQIGSNYDYLTVKYDSLGNIVWADTLDNGGDDYGRGIAVDNNGNVYVTGWSYIGANDDYFTVKYDSLGNILWADTLNEGGNDYALGIAVNNSGNIYVTGYSYIGTNDDYFTVKYDSLGNIVWADTLDNGFSDRAFGIVLDNSGNVYVTGWSYIGANYDYLTVKYDSLGNILRADNLNEGGDDYARGIAVDNSGNIYVTGFSYMLGTNYDYLTVKYNASGNILWADTLDNGNNYDYAWGIAVDDSGNSYVTGQSYIGTDYDYFTVKYDASGNILWEDTLDNDSTDYAYGIAVDNSGNIYVTGASSNGTNDDYFTVKYVKFNDAGIVSIVSPPDTVCIDSTYIPRIWVKNNSYELILNFDIAAYIDSAGGSVYGDTQTVSNLPAGDSVLVSFTEWTAPSAPVDLNLKFSILTPDMNPDNDTISKPLYVRFWDAGILSIASPDTVGTDSTYIPQIWVKNNSYQDTLNIDISSYIDSAGGSVYGDTQTVSNLPYGDSVLVSFAEWTAPSAPVDLNLKFSILTPDMNPDNDTISKPLYVRFWDAGILSIASPDTVGTDSTYIPQIWVKNNSYEDTLNIDISSYIDSAGGSVYGDTQTVSNLPYGDSVLVSFAEWTAPSAPMDLNLNFSIITSDMNPDNDTLSKPLYVRDLSGIAGRKTPEVMMLNVSTINRGKISFFYGIAGNSPYRITLYGIDGRVIRKIEGKGSGYHRERVSNLPSGVYFIRLKQEDEVINKKVVVIR